MREENECLNYPRVRQCSSETPQRFVGWTNMLNAGELGWEHRGCLDQFGPSSDLISSTLRVETTAWRQGSYSPDLIALAYVPCREMRKMGKAVTINLMRQITSIAGRCHEFITNLPRIVERPGDSVFWWIGGFLGYWGYWAPGLLALLPALGAHPERDSCNQPKARQ